MTSSLNLYVTSNGTDHGPMSLEEATKRVGTGEFKPNDISWHQGVSGWVPLKQLPEWSQINKAPLPSLTPETEGFVDEVDAQKPTKQRSQVKPSKIKSRINPNKNVSSPATFDESQGGKTGMGIFGKLMVAVAILVFLSTLGIVGFLIYQNLDKFIPPTIESTSEPVKEEDKEEEEKEEEEVEEPKVIDEPDPFASPVKKD